MKLAADIRLQLPDLILFVFPLVAALVFAGTARAQVQMADPGVEGSYMNNQILQQQKREADAARQATEVKTTPNQAPPVDTGDHGAGALRYWSKQPLVAPDRNGLLGRWNSHGGAAIGGAGTQMGDISNMFGTGVGNMVSGMLGSVCDSMFGGGLIEFRPDSLVSISPRGDTRVITRVEYRGAGDHIAILPQTQGAFGVIAFSIKRDRIVADQLGCNMTRAGSGTRSASAPIPANGAAPDTARASDPGGVLAITSPLHGGDLFLLRHDIDVLLTNAGVKPSAGATASMTWHAACETRAPACLQGISAMRADNAILVKTDAGGHAQTAPLPAGRYYVFGAVQVSNRAMMWNVPVDLKSGTNAVTLDQRNLSPL
ncbi:MAG: hypothetical protein ABSF50_21525 [Burkholderiaceae bacterium]|jgi:hypothetical protein